MAADKYMIIKVVDGTAIEDCFVIHPGKDPAAVAALQAYAQATENRMLADEIYRWVGKPKKMPPVQYVCTQCKSFFVPVDEEPCDGCTHNPATPWNGMGEERFIWPDQKGEDP